MGLDLSVDLGNFKLANPIMSASGTYGYNSEFEDFVEVKNLGAVVTKAISLKPRGGNDWERIFETHGGMINSIGLENVGIERFILEKLPVLKSQEINFVLNLAASTEDEYIALAKICEQNKIKAIELNVSCPNVKCGCLEFGTDENTLFGLVSKVRKKFSGCLIVKLTPNVTSIEKIALAAQNAGADAISAINTVKGLGIKLNLQKGQLGKQKLVQGGLSGKAIKPIALGAIKRIAETVDIPIIAMGGIYTLEDILEFFYVGASAVQIGTANFTYPDVTERLLIELQNFMQEHDIKNLDELKRKLRGQ